MCLFNVPAGANDSAFSGVGGTPRPMRGEHRSIQMQSEKILIRADAKGYSTDVDFVFVNHGGKTSVQMGFPETSYEDGDAERKTVFLRFATFVDGRKALAKRVITSQGGPETEAYWLKTVDFGPKQTRRVRVSYRSPWGGNTEWGTRTALAYDFTGKNWRGLVERSDLEIRVADEGLWLAAPHFAAPLSASAPLAMELEVLPTKGTPRVAVFRKTWRSWQAQGNFLFGLTRMVPFWMLDRADVGPMQGSPQSLATMRTFRIGNVPAELPSKVELPPAFRRNGVVYLSLNHLERRLGGFAYDLEKRGGTKPEVAVKWDAKTRLTTLTAGAQTLSFAPNAAFEGTSARPILLRGVYGDSLYVPLAAVAKNLGLTFASDVKSRFFDLKRGTWTGK